MRENRKKTMDMTRGPILRQIILFALPLLPGLSGLTVTPPVESAGYIAMTVQALRDSGIRLEQTGDASWKIPGSQQYAAANDLLNSAEAMLQTMDPGNPQYQAIRNAADYLRLLIGSDYPNQAEIMNAMETLTRAMGGVY